MQRFYSKNPTGTTASQPAEDASVSYKGSPSNSSSVYRAAAPKNLPPVSCKVEVERLHITIPSIYSTTYKYMAIARNTHLLRPVLTPNIEILCVLRGISYETLGLAKSFILTYIYI